MHILTGRECRNVGVKEVQYPDRYGSHLSCWWTVPGVSQDHFDMSYEQANPVLDTALDLFNASPTHGEYDKKHDKRSKYGVRWDVKARQAPSGEAFGVLKIPIDRLLFAPDLKSRYEIEAKPELLYLVSQVVLQPENSGMHALQAALHLTPIGTKKKGCHSRFQNRDTFEYLFSTPFEFCPGFVMETELALGSRKRYARDGIAQRFAQDLMAARSAWQHAESIPEAGVELSVTGPDRYWKFAPDPFWIQLILLARLVGGPSWRQVLGFLEDVCIERRKQNHRLGGPKKELRGPARSTS